MDCTLDVFEPIAATVVRAQRLGVDRAARYLAALGGSVIAG
jgi:hypothetical protein